MSATAMIYFDTLQYVKILEKAGIPDKQAEAFAKAQQKSLSECLDTTLASKKDLFLVKTELQAEIQEVKDDVHEVKTELKVHRWMLGVLLSGLGALIAGVGSLVVKMFF